MQNDCTRERGVGNVVLMAKRSEQTRASSRADIAHLQLGIAQIVQMLIL